MTVPQAIQTAFHRHQAGRLEEAEAIYRQILAVEPRHADALHMLGMLAHQTGRSPLAADLITRSLEIRPDDSVAYSNLSEVLRVLGRADEAIAAGREAIRLQPGSAVAHVNLGNVYQATGKLAEASTSYRRALDLLPDFAEAYYNLGNVLKEQGHLDEAVTAYRRALELKPGLAEALNNLGNVLRRQDKLDEEIACFRQALELRPDSASAYNNLGSALKDAGQLDETIVSYRRAMALEPQNPIFHSNLLNTLHLHPSYDAGALRRELESWNRQFAEPLRPHLKSHANLRDPDRPLRLGYLSPDFCDHVVGRNVLPILERHDHSQFKVFCYAGVTRPDALTRRFQTASDGWRDITSASDQAAADLIRSDEIDLLIDLSLHTIGHRLMVFARKPAPVQATWAGYPGSTGLPAIDYRITDPYLDPPDATEASSSERPIRLPHSFWCYDPLTPSPAVNPLPALSFGSVTFGSLNNYCKINREVIALWSEVLRLVPRSRLVLLSKEGAHRARALENFARHGVAADRIVWLPRATRTEYLAAYHRIDLGLDTFPYNGHTTSLDSAWMGVPVLALVGKTLVGRGGLSQAMNLGLPELAAKAPVEFVRRARDLTSNLPRLAELRHSLRPRMQSSPLMDAPRFTRDLEAAFRKMWREWCHSPAN